MRPPADAPKPSDYLRLIVSGWWVILAATVLSGLAGWTTWYTATPLYQSSAQLLVFTPGNSTTIDAYYGQMNAALRSPTYLQLARSGQVTARTIEQLGLATTPDELAAQISVVPVTPVLLDVTVSGTDPQRTRETADAVADNMIALSRLLAGVESGDAEMTKVTDAGPARRNGSEVDVIVQAAAVGLGVSTLLVLAYGVARDRLMARGQVARITNETLATRGE